MSYARIWHHIDARNRVVGRLASSIALTLLGKHKPIYERTVDCGDYVVVSNARHLFFTGDKLRQKGYYRHSGYPGGLTRVPARDMMERKPEEVLWRAVRGMLPKNRLRRVRMARLKIFPDETHPYAQNIAVSYETQAQRELDLSSLKIA